MKWHALIFADGLLAVVYLLVGQYVLLGISMFILLHFFPLVRYLQRKNIFNNVILCMASVFILK